MLKEAYCCGVVLAVLVMVALMLLPSPLDSPHKPLEASAASPLSTQPVALGSLPTVYLPPKKAIGFFSYKLLRSTDAILGAPWVSTLKKMLDRPGVGKQVVVVFGTLNYLQTVLNWLVATQVRLEPPLEDVIVFCLDLETFSVLSSRKIPAIFVDPKTVVNVARIHMPQIWLIRMVVYRLINYLGHDVMAYDSDAVVLRNPQKLLKEHQDSDIVGSAGKFPPKVGKVWGFTACMGMILVRSSPRTELLWESMNFGTGDFDDQRAMNFAINDCHINWNSKDQDIQKQSIDGQCSTGLKVTILPYSDVCRYKCSRPSERGSGRGEYVWHLETRSDDRWKKDAAYKAGVWFLRDSWNQNTSTDHLVGREWLKTLNNNKIT